MGKITTKKQKNKTKNTTCPSLSNDHSCGGTEVHNISMIIPVAGMGVSQGMVIWWVADYTANTLL